MTIADTLREARRRLEEPEKWGKGKELNDGRLCPLLVIEELSALQFFKTAIDGANVIRWNDAPERTHADVLQAFDKAIELAEKAE